MPFSGGLSPEQRGTLFHRSALLTVFPPQAGGMAEDSALKGDMRALLEWMLSTHRVSAALSVLGCCGGRPSCKVRSRFHSPLWSRLQQRLACADISRSRWSGCSIGAQLATAQQSITTHSLQCTRLHPVQLKAYSLYILLRIHTYRKCACMCSFIYIQAVMRTGR